jgi:hypothetical protein
MPSPLRNPKTLAQWFELDYFRRRRLFRGLWRPVVWGTLLVACLGVGWTLLPGKQSIYQAGPLTTAHAMFNQDCSVCHTEAFPVLKRLWTTDSSVRSVPDQACSQCHEGSEHHAGVEQHRCASCHHEHRGQAALSRVTDDQCNACHRDLTLVKKDSSFISSITRFTSGQHPEFRRIRDDKPDPGRLRFNHKVHLKGLLDIDRKQLAAQQKAQEQAGGIQCQEELPKLAVKLECNSCHKMDTAGRCMKPINFVDHCQNCHPLSVQLVGSWQGEERERACAFSKQLAPHPVAGETAEVVRAMLRDRLTNFIRLPANKSFLGKGEPEELPRPLPGWKQAEPVPPREFAWVNRQLEQIEHVLFDGGGGCKHCHTKVLNERDSGLPVYEQPYIQSIWFMDSVFSHDSHKMLTCTECHTEARKSETARDVMLPGIGKCLQCHHDGERGARADCVECHIYHDPKLKRQFQGTRTIDQALGK